MQPLIEKNKDLTSLTTFHIPVKAKFFVEYSSLEELKQVVATDIFQNNRYFHIGNGSNLLFLNDFDGIVLHSKIKGLKRYDKNATTTFVIAGAGEKWENIVNWCLDQNLSGIENLTGIPGEMGAAVVQNIGAYGVEIGNLIHNVECYDVINNEVFTLSKEDCKFGYRDSIFKNEGKNRYIILRVSLRLKNTSLAENLDYGVLKKIKEEKGGEISAREVESIVSEERKKKLPDPEFLGNAGSFFKNPVVHKYFYEEVMCARHQEIPYYPTPDPLYVKIPAGWLIEKSGLKGATVGDAEIYPKQCLIIINKGNATANDVKALAQKVEEEVIHKFGILLDREVEYIDTSMKITILGSGTSKGVPEIGCSCEVCTSEDPKDKRLRCSALVETMGVSLLIDVSPDFRAQALSEHINNLDAAVLTHSHYDHVGGLDDVRPFCGKGNFKIYARKDVLIDLHNRLDYCFKPSPYPGVPIFDTHEIGNTPFYIKGIKIIPISIFHGKLPIVGYRINDFAYLTDVKTIPEEEMEKLQNLKVLIINAIRDRSHFAHLSLPEALEIIRKLRPEKAYLTHFNHEIGRHMELEKRLPENVKPCYDGMVIRIK